MLDDPQAIQPKIRNAGAIFLGLTRRKRSATMSAVRTCSSDGPLGSLCVRAWGLDFMKRTTPRVRIRQRSPSRSRGGHHSLKPKAQCPRPLRQHPAQPVAVREFDPKLDKIVAVTLDPSTITSINPDEVHEWRIAIYDLVSDNKFHPARVKAKGPYALHLSIVGNSIVLDVRNPETYEPIAAHYLSLTPFRRSIRDYFRIRASYYEAIKNASTMQIETVDMARAASTTSRRTAPHASRHKSRWTSTRRAALHPDLRRAALCKPYRRAREQAATVSSSARELPVRSPIAAALARSSSPPGHGRSAGVFRQGRRLVHEVMEEIGVDMSVHTPHTLNELTAPLSISS